MLDYASPQNLLLCIIVPIIRTRHLTKVGLGYTSSGSKAITESGFNMHFLNIDAWNTLCTPTKLGVSVNL